MMGTTVLCLAVLTALEAPSEQRPTYSRTRDFHAVRMSYAQLSHLLTTVVRFLETANASDSAGIITSTITVEDDRDRMTVEHDFSLPVFSTAPHVAYAVNFSYRLRDGSISDVSIVLRDYGRSVTVEGASLEQVNALTALIVGELHEYETSLGGSTFRFWIGAALLMVVIFSTAIMERFEKDFLHPAATLVLIGLTFLVVLVPPWDRWLPGVAVFAGDASVLVRHAPLISFLGTAVGLASLVISAIALRRRPEERAPHSEHAAA